MTRAWPATAQARVLVVSEQDGVPAFVGELAADPQYRPLGRVVSVSAAVQAVKEHLPDVVLAEASSLRRLHDLAELSALAATVVVSVLPPETALLACMGGGARGFVWTPIEPGLLAHGVAAVLAGHVYVDPRSTEWLVDLAVQHHLARAEHGLTARQSEVLRLVQAGLTNKEIAEALGLSSETVKRHLQEAMRKLGVHDRRDAATRAGIRLAGATAPTVPAEGDHR